MSGQCTYADDAFLIQAWPSVVIEQAQQWQLTVNSVTPGEYAISVQGIPYPYTANPGDSVTDVRDGLQAALASALVTKNAFGLDRLDVGEVEAGTVTEFSATAPTEDDITLVQSTPADNADVRAFWLEQAKCFVNCCLIPKCAQQLYHASVAAWLLFDSLTTGSAGISLQNFTRWTLGPATLQLGSGSSSNGGALDRAGPAATLARLNDLYIPTVACSPCGVLCA